MKPVNVDLLVEEIVTLPTLPQNVDHVTQLVNDPDPTMAELGRAIATDPAFALKTLRLINSAYYGRNQEISSVELAVNLLGLKVIKNLVVTALVCETLRGARTLLRHSVATGFAMRALTERLGSRAPVDPDGSFSYGLLHDIGKIIIVTFLPQEAEEIMRVRADKRISLHQAEREVIGTDHAELGARLATRWKLPPRLAATIEAHHAPDSSNDSAVRQLSGMVAVASLIATEAGLPAEPGAYLRLGDTEWESSQLANTDLPPALDAFFMSLSSLEELTAAS